MLLRYALDRFEGMRREDSVSLSEADGKKKCFHTGPTYENHFNEIKLKKDCSCAASGLRRQPLLCVLETVASCDFVEPVTEDPSNQNPLNFMLHT